MLESLCLRSAGPPHPSHRRSFRGQGDSLPHHSSPCVIPPSLSGDEAFKGLQSGLLTNMVTARDPHRERTPGGAT